MPNDVRYVTPMEAPIQAISRNLRKRRVGRGVSLSELSRLAGISKSTLSALERGTANPAIETLWALATALDIPLAALFDGGPADEIEVKRLADAQVVVAEDSGITLRTLRTRHARG